MRRRKYEARNMYDEIGRDMGKIMEDLDLYNPWKPTLLRSSLDSFLAKVHMPTS